MKTGTEPRWESGRVDASSLSDAARVGRSLGGVRGTWFSAKADVACDDGHLRRLRETASTEAARRTPMVRTAVAVLLGRQRVDVVPSPVQGTFHLVHRVRTDSLPSLIVRSSRPDLMDPDDTLRVETKIAPYLARADLPRVRVRSLAVGTDRVAPFDLAIQDAAPGYVLCHEPETACESPSLWYALGRIMGRLHAIVGVGGGPVDVAPSAEHENLRGLHPDWGTYLMLRLEDHVGRCREIGTITEDQGAMILAAFRDHAGIWNDVPTRLLHGDLGNQNLFVHKDVVTALIDWEDALIGDPAFDVATWASFHPLRRHAAFLRGYGPDTENDWFRLRCALSFLRIALAKTVHRHRFAYTDQPGRPPAHDRIRRGMAAVERVLAGRRGDLFG